jgi:hypothetical protein
VPGFTHSVDTRNFDAWMHDISSMDGAALGETVLLNQAGVLLNKCIELTPKRLASDIETSVKFKNRNLWENESPSKRKHGDPIISATKSGVIWFVDEPGKGSKATGKHVGSKTFHIMDDVFRWSNDRWSRYQTALAQLTAEQINVENAKRSRGLAARSWLQIAESLGIDLNSCGGEAPPGYVRSATPVNGREYTNGRGQKISEGAAFSLELVNDYPALANPDMTHGRIDGYAILQRAMDKRTFAMQKDMELGVFQSIAKRSTRYPGIFVS